MNKNLLVGLSLALLIVLGSGYYVLFANKPTVSEAPPPSPEETVLMLKPEDIGLTLTARSDKRAVKFEIAKSSDISSVEYQVTYTAEGDIPRGAIGNIEVESGDEMIESNYIDLGTCSSNKCKYDVVVSPVSLLLKITKKDGKVYQVEDSLSL